MSLWLNESESSVMSHSLWPHGLCSQLNSPGQNTGVGSLSLHQGIFPTQGSNPGLPHCRKILYQLSYQEIPRILEWVAYPFSSRSSQSGIERGSPALQVDSLPTELSGKPWCGLITHFNYLIIVCYIVPQLLYTFTHLWGYQWLPFKRIRINLL